MGVDLPNSVCRTSDSRGRKFYISVAPEGRRGADMVYKNPPAAPITPLANDNCHSVGLCRRAGVAILAPSSVASGDSVWTDCLFQVAAS